MRCGTIRDNMIRHDMKRQPETIRYDVIIWPAIRDGHDTGTIRRRYDLDTVRYDTRAIRYDTRQ